METPNYTISINNKISTLIDISNQKFFQALDIISNPSTQQVELFAKNIAHFLFEFLREILASENNWSSNFF